MVIRRVMLASVVPMLLAGVLVFAFGFAVTFGFAVPAGASTTTTIVPLPDQSQQQAPRIIPLPDSGSPPQRQGDPGTATQYAVLFGTMGAMVLIALLIRRESNRKKDLRTPKVAQN